MSDARIASSESVYEFEVAIRVNGAVELTPGLENAVILSLWGGNYEDDGTPGRDAFQWWANLLETEKSKRLRSKTQAIIDGMPASTANLHRLHAAVLLDLEWMTETNVASSIEAGVRMLDVKTVQIDVFIEAEGAENHFTFTSNWKAST